MDRVYRSPKPRSESESEFECESEPKPESQPKSESEPESEPEYVKSSSVSEEDIEDLGEQFENLGIMDTKYVVMNYDWYEANEMATIY